MKTLLILGGSGFVGKSILDAFLKLQLRRFKIDKLVILSRNTNYLKREFKIKNNKKIIFKNVDLFKVTKLPYCDYIIHAAEKTLISPINKKLYLRYFNLTKKICNYFIKFKNIKFLYLSSGAVYGKIDKKKKVKENDLVNLNYLPGIRREYAKYKIKAENYLKKNFNKDKLIIARLFSFNGQFLLKNKHYAVGNFLKDAKSSDKIKVKSSSPDNIYRSYLDSSDLVQFLMHLIVGKNKTKNNIFNVGSDRAISIKQLAEKIAKISHKKIYYNNKIKSNLFDYYVPNINKIKKNYPLKKIITIEKSLLKNLNNINKN